MTKTTSPPYSGRLALLAVVAFLGCDTLTTPDPTTEAQAEAIVWTQRAAWAKGIRLDGIVFDDPVYCGKGCVAGAWAVCGEYAIGWNKDWIEQPTTMQWIPEYACHEVCHIYYKDNLPCRIRPAGGREEMEKRATECGSALYAEIKP